MLGADLEMHQNSHVPAEVQLPVRGGDHSHGSRNAEPLVLAPAGMCTYGSIHKTSSLGSGPLGLLPVQALGLLYLGSCSDSLVGFLWQRWPVAALQWKYCVSDSEVS